MDIDEFEIWFPGNRWPRPQGNKTHARVMKAAGIKERERATEAPHARAGRGDELPGENPMQRSKEDAHLPREAAKAYEEDRDVQWGIRRLACMHQGHRGPPKHKHASSRQ